MHSSPSCASYSTAGDLQPYKAVQKGYFSKIKSIADVLFEHDKASTFLEKKLESSFSYLKKKLKQLVALFDCYILKMPNFGKI